MTPERGLGGARVRGPGRARTPGAVAGAAATVALAAVACLPPLLPLAAQSARQVARSPHGMVVTAQPLATLAGRRMLELGGNAADAAVAAAFAIAVVEPSMSGLGGRNQILIRTPRGELRGIDGTTQVPAVYDQRAAPRAASGYTTVGVPGAVAGLLRLHAEHGSLPLTQVMDPAIDYAHNGFRLTAREADRQAGAARDLAESEGARRYFLRPDGRSYRAGELFVQSDLANTLRRIAAGGAEEFYAGSIAEQIAADMQANGGFVTRSALATYAAVPARVVRGTYRGHEIVGLDVPASGAIAIQALHIAEHFDPDELGPEAWAAVLAQAVALAAPDRPALGSDSAAARATSKEWAAVKADRIRAAGRPMGGEGREPGMATRLDWLAHDGHTTHLSTADADGMMVGLTQTIGPTMGSRVATPGLGFLYAVTMGGYLGPVEPGDRGRSSITPLFVAIDGRPVMILGAAGGGRIISAVVQVISRVVDDGMTLSEALAAPRVHPASSPPDSARSLEVEAAPGDGWGEAGLSEFRRLGFEVEPTRRRGAFGRIHAVGYDAVTGMWIGVADPDWEGSAEGPVDLP